MSVSPEDDVGPDVETPEPDDDLDDDFYDEKMPFGFVLTLVALALYLSWRLVEGVVWLVQRI